MNDVEKRTAQCQQLQARDGFPERKSLLKWLTEIWQKICGKKPEPKPEPVRALAILNEQAWQELTQKLRQTEALDNMLQREPALSRFARHFESYKKKLNRFCAAAPAEYDEETTEDLIPKLCDLLNEFKQILEACNLNPSSRPHQRFAEEIDKYFKGFGVNKVEFKANTPGDAWYKLDGKIETVQATPANKDQIGRIAHIMVQPRMLVYKDRDNEDIKFNFCGKCSIFSEYSSEIE